MLQLPETEHADREAEADVIRAFVALDPIAGTQMGLSGSHDGRLPATDLAERRLLVENLERVTAGLGVAGHTLPGDRLDGEVARAGARGMALTESALSPLERNPGWYVSTAVEGLYGLFLRTDLTREQLAEYALARLSGLTSHFAAAQRNLTRPAAILVENALGDAQGALDFCDLDLRRELSALGSTSAAVALDRALADGIEALKGYRAFLEGYRNDAGGEFSAGRDAFDALLHESYLLPLSAAGLVDLGHELVEALSAELVSRSKAAFGTPNWWEPIAELSEQLPPAYALIDRYERLVDRVSRFVAERQLLDLSLVGPVEVVVTPPFARTNLPFAAYVGAPPFGSGRAQFWVTPIDETQSPQGQRLALSQHHLGRMLVACIHEATPGHHVEFSLSRAIKRPLRHLFRSTIFTEGWAFYCEGLVARSGLLAQFPESAALGLAFLRDELWRALRILIDVGLHCFQMTPESAVRLLTEHHIMSLAGAQAEVSYSCGAPTQPLSYMVGRRGFESIINGIRSDPANVGQSLSETHAKVLSHGPIPLNVLVSQLSLSGSC